MRWTTDSKVINNEMDDSKVINNEVNNSKIKDHNKGQVIQLHHLATTQNQKAASIVWCPKVSRFVQKA